jgi:hypothetical protein
MLGLESDLTSLSSAAEAILSESLHDSLKQIRACVGGTDMGILGILQERNLVHCWIDLQTIVSLSACPQRFCSHLSLASWNEYSCDGHTGLIGKLPLSGANGLPCEMEEL